MSTATSEDESISFDVSVTVKNEGAVTGSEVVQLYISYPDLGVTTPQLQLRGFGKARDVAPGDTQKIVIHLDKYALSFWNAKKGLWSAKAGTYSVHVGSSSENLVLGGKFELGKSFEWSGL